MMANRTPLHQQHVDAGARMVPFAGWDMPLHYGSQIAEHEAVRERAGVFDVSHMTVVDVDGSDAEAWLRRLLCNDVAKLKEPGHALYTPMLNAEGGIIDDLIVYRLDAGYRLVVNSATREADLAWLDAQVGDAAVTVSERPEQAMLAVQGPEAMARLEGVLGAATVATVNKLKPFRATFHAGGTNGGSTGPTPSAPWLVARTGYTGEDGVEIILPDADAPALWRAVVAAGIQPAGLGARDTLRLEAGLNLYGQDMDTEHTPLTSNLAWTVAWKPAERDFIGRAALEAEKAAGVGQQLTGLVLEERGVPRHGHIVFADGEPVGQVTSGIFAPTLAAGIALVRVRAGLEGPVQLEVRNRRLAARLVKPPFVRNGHKVFE